MGLIRNKDKPVIRELMLIGLKEIEASELEDRGWKPHVAVGIPYDKPTIAEARDLTLANSDNLPTTQSRIKHKT